MTSPTPILCFGFIISFLLSPPLSGLWESFCLQKWKVTSRVEIKSLFLFRILRGFVKNRRKSKKTLPFFFLFANVACLAFSILQLCLPPLLFYLYSFHSVVCSSSVSLIPLYNSKFKWDNKKRSIHGNTTNLYFFPHFENLIKLFIGRRTE